MKENTFYFDKFKVDPSSLSIYDSDNEQQIEFRYMQLLCLLADNEKILLTREQISDVLWPNVVVGHDNVTSAIFALRSALGDSAKNPKYIQTVPKKGYRFLPEVHCQPIGVDHNLDVKGRSWKKIVLACATLSLISACCLSAFYLIRSNGLSTSPERLMAGTLQPFTYQDGAEISLAMNASKNTLAYIHKHNRRFDIYTKKLEDGKPHRWTEDGHSKRSLQWLNENALIFIRCTYISQRECQIVSQNKLGSETVWYSTSRRIRYIAPASPDKKSWIFVELINHDHAELKEINLLTGVTKNWKEEHSELPNKIAFPHFNNQSGSLFFIKEEKGKPYLQHVDTNSKVETTLNQSFEEIQFFSGVNAEYGVISGKTNGRSGIWLFNYAHEKLSLLVPTVADEFINSVHLDLSQNILYYASITTNSDIVEYDQTGQVFDLITGINSSHEDYYPSVGAKSKYVYFVSNRSGSHELWRFSRSTQKIEKLTQVNASFFTRPLPSPNGQFVAFVAKVEEYALFVLDLLNNAIHAKSISKVQTTLSWSDNSEFFYTVELDNKGKTRRYRRSDLFEDEVYDFVTPLYFEDEDPSHIFRVERRKNILLYENGNNGSVELLIRPPYPLKRLRPEKIVLNGDKLYIAQKDSSNTKEALYQYSLQSNDSGAVEAPAEPWIKLPTGVYVNYIYENGTRVLAVDKNQAFGDIVRVELE